MSRRWTKEEEEFLITHVEDMSMKELMEALDRTDGAIRNKKLNLGIKRGKYPPYTNEEKEFIRNWYISHNESSEGGVNLDKLSKILNRPKTSVSKVARDMGLTRYGNFSKAERKKRAKKMSVVAKTYPSSGFTDKHHSLESKRQMSTKLRENYNNMNDEEKQGMLDRLKVNRKIASSSYKVNKNSYSRCKGGFREDIQQYVRSSWEANIIRLFNYIGVAWQYEPKRFQFESVGSGEMGYIPDFYLPNLDVWVEVKGWMDNRSKAKLKYFNQYYPDQYEKLMLIDAEKYYELEREYKYVIPNWELPKQSRRKSNSRAKTKK